MASHRYADRWWTWTRLKVGILGVFTLMSAIMVSLGVEQALMNLAKAPDPMWSLATAGGISVAFAVVTWLFGMTAYDEARRRIRTRARLIPETAGERARVMIMTLSRPLQKDDQQLNLALRELAAIDQTDRRALDALLDRICLTDFEDRAKAPYTGWKWQQPFRLIRFQGLRLKQIILVLSNEVEARKDAIKAFKLLAKPFLDPDCSIIEHEPAIDMNDYDGTERAIHGAIQRAQPVADRWGGEARICIDISGGNKIWSAVAVLATINTKSLFAYVQPDAPYHLLSFDGEQKPA